MKRPIYAPIRIMTPSGAKADDYIAVGTIDFEAASSRIVCRITLGNGRLGELVVFNQGENHEAK